MTMPRHKPSNRPGQKEINKIFTGSDLREIADFLTDPDNGITDCVLCYQTEYGMGYRLLGDSSLATVIGLLEVVKDQMRSQAVEALEEALDDNMIYEEDIDD